MLLIIRCYSSGKIKTKGHEMSNEHKQNLLEQKINNAKYLQLVFAQNPTKENSDALISIKLEIANLVLELT